MKKIYPLIDCSSPTEGKFLLELSHRTDMGAPAGWVPVKSKTYWPPPSSTTTTTTQHPLRHDTPTSQSGMCFRVVLKMWTPEIYISNDFPLSFAFSSLFLLCFSFLSVVLSCFVLFEVHLFKFSLFSSEQMGIMLIVTLLLFLLPI